MTITHSSTRIVGLAAGVAVAAALAFGAFAVAPAQAALTSAQISSIVSLLQSFGADATTIANVQASLLGQPTSGTGTGTGTGGACPALSRDLEQNATGADVLALQQFLNGSADTMVAVSGAGSPGSETQFFGPATKAAVMKFQTKYNITPIAGYVGSKTRAQISAVCGTVVTPGPGPVTPTGPGITVSATAQPSNALAPLGSNRLPFTNFMVTNNTAAAVTVNSVTIERTGLGVDSNFSGVVLVDSGALQLGTAKTLNSNHQASLDGFTLNPGETKSLTVAGNISSTATGNNGQVVSLKIVAINSSAPVAGSLPIVGASHTINTTLTLGSVSTTTSSFDPGSTQSKNIGDTGVRVSGLRFTAGSAEDLRLYSVRWRQVGTASSVDLANVVSVVDGTSYPTTVSSDGKYYTTVFPGGLFIAKGNSIDLYNMADLVGSNSASRTVDFDIDKVTDVYFVGQTYGYGIAPSGTYQPWFDGYATTINAGTVTTIGKATEVAAQNIAANVPNQVLGGFVTDFKGEAVSVTSLPITIATSSDMSGVLTSISIVDENGVVVAGPVDEASTCTTTCTVTFTDTITFPTGRHIYTVKGKIPSGASNNSTVIVSTTPSSWSGVTGQVTGNTITISTGVFAMNTMTIKAAALVVSLSTSPSSQTVVGGGQGILLANLQLDASQSGEDVRISSVPIILTLTTMVIGELNTCQVFDGTTPLNTGSNVPSTLAASGSATTYTFDNSMTIAKGTIKTLGLKCNISSAVTAVTDSLVASISTSAANWSATGVTSGGSITETFGNATGGTMTMGAGSVTVTVDSSSPSYKLVTAGSTGVTVGVIKLRATNEPITLTKLGLTLTNSGNTLSKALTGGGSTNGGVSDLTQVYLYDGSTLVGTVSFTGTNTSATSSALSITLPKDSDKLLTVKADLANIGVSEDGGVGDVVKVDPLNAEGTGQSSGTTIQSGATAGVAGIQMYKSYPVVSNAGTQCTNTTSCNGTAQTLKKFTVTANSAGPISLYEVSVKLATSSASVTNLKLYAYTSDYGSGPANVSGTTGGQFGGTAALGGLLDIAAPTVSFIQTTPYSFTGTTYFVVEGDVAPASAATVWSVNATIMGDAATSTQVAGTNANKAATVGATQSASLGYATSTTKNFVWSDNASTTPGIQALDWFDGYYVSGLPSSGF